MGDIADMMLEGILDEETGEYIGDINLDRYGTESPGFPVSYERETREEQERKIVTQPGNKITKLPCPICKKKVKPLGLSDHIRNQHGDLI